MSALLRLITFKIFINLLTPIFLSLIIRSGSRRERQRRTVANRQQKRSLLAIEGIPSGGGKPKKACNHAIIAGPPFGSQIVSSGIAIIAEIAKIGNFEALLRLTASN
jgi:hypothetical protein